MWEVWNQRSAAVPCVDVHKLTTHRWKGHPRHRIHQWKYFYHHRDVLCTLSCCVRSLQVIIRCNMWGCGQIIVVIKSKCKRGTQVYNMGDTSVGLVSQTLLSWLLSILLSIFYVNDQYSWKYSHPIHCIITSVIIIIIILIITLWMRATASPSDIAPPTWILVE